MVHDTGALLSWLQSTTRHGDISAYHSIQSYGVPHAARKQWTWEQDPRRHYGIPSRLEEGAPAPEPRLGPFLSRSRYFLFLLGVQLGKQGVFSVPLDPHARCIRRGRTGGAVGPVRIKKIPSQCTCKVRDTEIAIWPGPLRTLGPRETASPSLPRRRFLPSPRLHRRAVLPTPHSLAGGWGEGTQCCGGVRKNGGHCRPAVWFWFRASHCPLRLPRRLMSCHLTTCPHPTHFFQVHFQLVKYFIAVARVQPIS
jgi:hypothetical protein